jgi:hypothetical protein
VSGNGSCSGRYHAAGKAGFHRAQKHAAPGKQIVVNTLVVFHHVPAWCGKRQAGLNNGKIHHFLIQRLIKQLLPGKIGQRQSAAPCERVLRRYDQVKGVVQDGGALDLRLQRPKGQIEGCVCLAAEHFVGVA